jgi:RNA polymerase sigma factor (sigma-70 family)
MGVMTGGERSAVMMDMGEFTAAHADGLHRHAYLLTRDAEESADLTQAVLAQLAARGLDGLDDPVAYARSCVYNGFRSGRRRAALRVRELIAAAGQDRGPTDTHQIEDRDLIWRALATLSARERAAIVLKYYEDLPDDQIAGILGCASGTVRSLVSRGKQQLRAELGPRGSGREESG